MEKLDVSNLISDYYDRREIRRVGAHQFLELIETRAKEFRSEGLSPYQRVALLGGNNLQFLIDLFGIWSCGGTSIPLPRIATDSELKSNLLRLCPHYVIENNGRSPSKLQKTMQLDRGEIEIEGLDLTKAKPALALLTSGSSALPKIVLHSESSLMNRLRHLDRAIPLESRENTLALLPTQFAHGLIGIVLSAIYSGAHLHLTPGLDVQRIAELKDWLAQSNPQFISATPGAWKLILKCAGESPPAIKRLQLASAPSSPKLWEALWSWALAGGREASLHHAYGLTETASWVSSQPWFPHAGSTSVGNGTEFGSRFHFRKSPVSGENAQEILIESEALALGYLYIDSDAQNEGLQDGRLKLEPLPLHPIDSNHTAYATGDLGELDAEGNLTLRGRFGRLINRAGFKISPEEIEAALSQHEAISGSLALPIGEMKDDVGLIVAFNSIGLSVSEKHRVANELFQHLSRRLSREKLPSQIRSVASLPLRPSGKIDLCAAQEVWKGAEVIWPGQIS